METHPKTTVEVEKVIKQRLDALEDTPGSEETITVEWRGQPKHISIIPMPIKLLYYNPGTHRIRAQRLANADNHHHLDLDPFGAAAQASLHSLLKSDPAAPDKVDSSFDELKDDLELHGQREPGLITRSGVLINGNTRLAALKDLGSKHMRVGVLPPDASHEDLLTLELSFQLRKEYKRDYSYMNYLLAVDDLFSSDYSPSEIQDLLRISEKKYERSRWVLSFLKEAITRSQIKGINESDISLTLTDFEGHQGKLEELYRSYTEMKMKSPDNAEAIKEQRLLAILFDKSKTDLRLIEPDFVQKYVPSILPEEPKVTTPDKRLPGTSITAPGPSAEVEVLRSLATEVLQAHAVKLAPSSPPGEMERATERLRKLEEELDGGLQKAGKNARLLMRKLAAVDRLGEVRDYLDLTLQAVAEAQSTGNFSPEDIDEVLTEISQGFRKLAQSVARVDSGDGDGLSWLRSIGPLSYG